VITAPRPTRSVPDSGPVRRDRPSRHRVRGMAVAAVAAVALSAGMLLGLPRGVAADGTASMKVDPATVTVDGGQTVTVDLVQSAAVETTGAQTNVVYDPKLIQITDMKAGPAYEGGLFLFGSVADGSSSDVNAALAVANQTGQLKNVATLLLPGSGTVPAGDNVFLTLTITGVEGPGGTTPLVLRRISATQGVSLLDANGAEIPVTPGRGSVTVTATAGAATTGVATTGATAHAPTASSAVAAATGAPAGASALAAVAMAPAATKVDVGATTTVDLNVNTGFPASGVVGTFGFDRRVLQVTGVEVGEAWKAGQLVVDGATLDQAIATANETGQLAQVGVAVLPGAGTPPTGEGSYLKVTMKGILDGTATLGLTKVSILDATGQDHKVDVSDVKLVVGSGGGGGIDPMPILLVVAVAVVAIGGGYLFIRSRRYEDD
jgi:hypothetical protein